MENLIWFPSLFFVKFGQDDLISNLTQGYTAIDIFIPI